MSKTTNLALASLQLSLDQNAKSALYQQLLQQLRQQIISGQLQADERLPSSRALAEQLQVSRITVLNAYEQLIAEGYLHSRPGAGVFVATTITKATTGKANIPYPDTPASKPIHYQGFSSGPDTQAFPFPFWSRCLAKAWHSPDPALLSEHHPGGYWPLREQIASYLKRLRGINAKPEQIIVTAGHRDALQVINRLLCLPGDKVILENPGYPIQTRVVTTLGLQPVYTDVDEQGAQIPDYQGPKLAILTASRQYPLGITMSGPRRHQWLHYAQQQSCWLIEDDYDNEFRYQGQPPPSMISLDQQQRTILMGSFSKLMFQHIRMGYLVLPEALAEAAQIAQMELGAMASVHIQPAIAAFLADHQFVSHMRRMSKLYESKRDYLATLIEQQLANYFAVARPDSGMHLIATAKHPMDDYQLELELNKQSIFCPALSRHYQDTKKAPQGFVMGFSGTTEVQMQANIEKLKSLLELS